MQSPGQGHARSQQRDDLPGHPGCVGQHRQQEAGRQTQRHGTNGPCERAERRVQQQQQGAIRTANRIRPGASAAKLAAPGVGIRPRAKYKQGSKAASPAAQAASSSK